MQVIYPNKIASVSANYADSEYPAAYVLDDHITRPWKSTLSTGTLTFSVDGIAHRTDGKSYFSVGVYETNAIQVAITVKNYAGTTLSTATYNAGASTWYGFITGTGAYFKSLWHNYNHADCESNHTVTIAFSTGSADAAFCGIVRIGESRILFRNPDYGISEGLKDYSIIKELNNGARYYRDRGRSRIFSGKVMLLRNPGFYQWMHDVAKAAGPMPLAWLLYSDTDATMTSEENKWAVFGYFDGMPSASHDFYSHSNINFSIVEAI